MKVRISDCQRDDEYNGMLFKLGYKPDDEVPEHGDILLKLFYLIQTLKKEIRRLRTKRRKAK